MARAFATAPAPEGGLTPVQRAVLNALVESMTGVALDVATLEPLGPAEFAEAIRDRNLAFREPHGPDDAARRDAARADPARGHRAGRDVRRSGSGRRRGPT